MVILDGYLTPSSFTGSTYRLQASAAAARRRADQAEGAVFQCFRAKRLAQGPHLKRRWELA